MPDNALKQPFALKVALAAYNLLWKGAKPFLYPNSRLRQGWNERTVRSCPQGPFDVWIQAASVGESYLALELLRTSPFPVRSLITTCTSQGLNILRAKQTELGFTCTYFPFDAKDLLKKFICAARPALALLLETEIWPSMLQVCRQENIPVCVVNARMSARSFSRYRLLRFLLAHLSPDQILALSRHDQQRFQTLFPVAKTAVMGNIKFDSFLRQKKIPCSQNPLATFLGPTTPPTVFASVREEEEETIFETISTIRTQAPSTVMAVVPRHAHRVTAWQDRLREYAPALRSELKHHVAAGSIIIWDTFGELSALYALARHVFVGGSLAPLGGQNFLEPLAQGVRPVIGPYWDNFLWVGEEIFEQGLVRQVASARELAAAFLSAPDSNPKDIIDRAKNYAEKKGGGCKQVWQMVQNIQQ